MIYGSLFALSEYKDQREYGILTEPDDTGSFWVRVQREWLFVRLIPEIDDETLQVLQVKRTW